MKILPIIVFIFPRLLFGQFIKADLAEMGLKGKVKSIVQWDSVEQKGLQNKKHELISNDLSNVALYFDKKGYITHYISINWDNLATDLFDTFFYNNSQRIEKIERYFLFADSSKMFKRISFYRYDTLNNTCYITSDENSRVSSIKYDKDFDIVQIINYDSLNAQRKQKSKRAKPPKEIKNIVSGNQKIIYEFDEYKNWVKRIGFIKNRRTWITTRHIVYYE